MTHPTKKLTGDYAGTPISNRKWTRIRAGLYAKLDDRGRTLEAEYRGWHLIVDGDYADEYDSFGDVKRAVDSSDD